jgi:hypothetical protein
MASTKESIKDTLKIEGKFDIMHYASNVNDIIMSINDKIANFEIKLTSLKVKEEMISNIINHTNSSADKFLKEHNYAKAQGLQNALITQFETYSMMQDMILKYEHNIQAYLKMKLDIENHKISAYTKIKAADKNVEKDDNNYKEMQNKIEQILSSGDSSGFKKHVLNELSLEGY